MDNFIPRLNLTINNLSCIVLLNVADFCIEVTLMR